VRIFDAYVEPARCASIDLENLAYFGSTRALLGLGYVGARDAQAILRALERLLHEETARLRSAKISAQVALGLSHAVFPLRGVRAVWLALRDLLADPRAAAVGPLSLGEGSEPEQAGFSAQVALAAECQKPCLVALPERGKLAAVYAALAAASRAGLPAQRLAFLHADTRALLRARAAGAGAILSVHPSHGSAESVARLLCKHGVSRAMLASNLGAGPADFLSLPRTGLALGRAGLNTEQVEKVLYQNAADFFSPLPSLF
jgi:predicted metal-dependent TIM-barrel fold hydrolase